MSTERAPQPTAKASQRTKTLCSRKGSCDLAAVPPGGEPATAARPS